jgi:nitrate reductase gamma subunit
MWQHHFTYKMSAGHVDSTPQQGGFKVPHTTNDDDVVVSLLFTVVLKGESLLPFHFTHPANDYVATTTLHWARTTWPHHVTKLKSTSRIDTMQG